MVGSIKILGRLIGFLLICLMFSACATPPEDSNEPVETYEETNDPLEPFNRSMFKLNEAIDQIFLEPVARVYDAVLPDFAQDMVMNFTRYLNLPRVLLNDIFQGNKKQVGETLGRFILNSFTLGLFDPASEAGIPYHNEDFGQTMAVWGVSEGPYLVLPIFGPKTVRSASGSIVDTYTSLVDNYAKNTNQPSIAWGKRALEIIDSRARRLDQIDDLRTTSLDFYTTVRSLYLQSRQNMIDNTKNQTPDFNDSTLSYDFEDEIEAMDDEINVIE